MPLDDSVRSETPVRFTGNPALTASETGRSRSRWVRWHGMTSCAIRVRSHIKREMASGHGHNRRGAARGWWAIAARMLALVLALSLVAPNPGYADDLAYHVGAQGHVTEMTCVDAAPNAGALDPGLACHLHCGCHQAAPVTAALAEPVFDGVRPLYAWLTETASSIAPDRLPRPPRA